MAMSENEDTNPTDATVAQGTGSAIPQPELARLSDDIVWALKTVYDPEIRPTSTSSA